MFVPQKYRKKPVEVEAFQFLGWRNVEELRRWASGHVFYVPRGYEHRLRYVQEMDGSGVRDDAPEFLVITTLDSEARADYGDWIIKGVKGEFYPCKDDILEATYDFVPEKI